MTENVHVVGERLIAYLYGEADARERALVDAHLIVCAACADELSGLGATRQHLAEWAPPDVALGFQITRPLTAADAPVTVLRPPRWWNRSTPVWAHAAAAVLIFAAGLMVGTSRGPVAEAPGANPQAASSVAVAAPPVTPSAFSAPAPAAVVPARVDQLAREVERLRADFAALSSSPAVASNARARASAPGEADMLMRVRELIADSEAGLRTDMTLRDTQLARDIDLQRRADLERVSRSIDVANGQMGAEVRQQRQTIEGLAKVVGLSVAPGR